MILPYVTDQTTISFSKTTERSVRAWQKLLVIAAETAYDQGQLTEVEHADLMRLAATFRVNVALITAGLRATGNGHIEESDESYHDVPTSEEEK